LELTTIPNESSTVRRPAAQFWVREMWGSIAITAMWIAVVVTAIVGPDIKSVSAVGDSTTVPAAVAVAMFACIGTWFVARYAFRRD
jgi:hypothetical protein